MRRCAAQSSTRRNKPNEQNRNAKRTKALPLNRLAIAFVDPLVGSSFLKTQQKKTPDLSHLGSNWVLLAERGGFEPPVAVTLRTLSKRVPSAAQPSLLTTPRSDC